MKKMILCLIVLMGSFAFADTYLEDHIENVLEAKYSYISDKSKYLELDFDVHKDGKDVYINVTVDDDFYIAKTDFNKNIFDNYVKQIKETAQSKSKGKNIIVNSYF